MVNIIHTTITFEQAKRLAEESASFFLSDFLKDAATPLLQEHYLEAEHCWMFFRNKDIAIPPDRPFCDGAYAISKKGNGSYIADLSDNPEKLQAYLQTMSNYFKQRGE
ncbi:hypothetical protein [Paraherbaspirillum soli]|uniref:Immunity protein 35 domain-containing protein n=1 Tax=Paraherbaspirillum soli TaxID=631222 RepID=A0ABW0MCA3_9BURK